MDKTKATVNKTIISVNGALHEKSKVIIDEISKCGEKVRVTDEMGRIFWVSQRDISIINP